MAEPLTTLELAAIAARLINPSPDFDYRSDVKRLLEALLSTMQERDNYRNGMVNNHMRANEYHDRLKAALQERDEALALVAGLGGRVLGPTFYTYDDTAYMGPGKRRRCRNCDEVVFEFKVSDGRWHTGPHGTRNGKPCPVGVVVTALEAWGGATPPPPT